MYVPTSTSAKLLTTWRPKFMAILPICQHNHRCWNSRQTVVIIFFWKKLFFLQHRMISSTNSLATLCHIWANLNLLSFSVNGFKFSKLQYKEIKKAFHKLTLFFSLLAEFLDREKSKILIYAFTSAWYETLSGFVAFIIDVLWGALLDFGFAQWGQNCKGKIISYILYLKVNSEMFISELKYQNNV